MLPSPFLQGLAKGRRRRLRAALSRSPALVEHSERIAEIVLGPGPFKRHARAGIFLQGFAIGGDGLLKPRRPGLPLPSVDNAIPRFIWVMAQSSGTRARVFSCKASG